MRLPVLLTTSLFPLGIIGAVAAGLIGGALIAQQTASGENVPGLDNKGLYDNTTPGVPTNIRERFCVRDFSTDPNFSALGTLILINPWLNDSAGWESIGTTKVDFLASSCSSATITYDFYDEADIINLCGGAFAGCAPFREGAVVTIDGHSHWTVSRIVMNTLNWMNFPDPTYRRRLINHETGHALGFGHGGPTRGVIGDGGIYDTNYNYNPAPNEAYQGRAHLNGRASPALHACLGYPAANDILVTWFDTAIDDNRNDVSLWRSLNHGGSWTWVYDTQEAGVPDYGSRFTYRSGPRGDVSDATTWTARADVRGGPRNDVNWDPVVWAPGEHPQPNTVPNNACTFKLKAPGNGALDLTWKDASFNETGFDVYYIRTQDGGALIGNWVLRGTCPANVEGCGDPTPGFVPGDWICAKIVAKNGYGSASLSTNLSCTVIN